MKRSGWVLYLFDNDKKIDIFKIMEFKTIKQMAYVLEVDAAVISNWYHGLILPRGILKSCMLVQSVPI